jgi:2-dehydro-3-deoxyphosphogluconate aldolase / (4S)-4-hydroxy-2-oxoglutarate aldolase
MLIREILALGPLIPVVVIDDADAAVPLAKALIAGGIRVIEVTLRTDTALAAIRRIAAEVPDAIVGAGTVLRPQQFAEIEQAGAAFAVSPGATPELLAAARDSKIPFLPGAATASEAMRLLESGYQRMKFFPAESAGGAGLLASLASPLPDAKFCPTGGIDLTNAESYLRLPNVVCVGSSWPVPAAAIRGREWDKITERARTCVALRRQAA